MTEYELWFVLVDNPGRLRLHVHRPDNRLWRKNLRGQQRRRRHHQSVDGVDPNRNFADEVELRQRGRVRRPELGDTFHGAGPASEPEGSRCIRGLIQRIRPKFLIDYHSFAQLILYPFGWQVETPWADDTPLMAGLAGDG